VRILMPLIVTDSQMDEALDIMDAALTALTVGEDTASKPSPALHTARGNSASTSC